MTEVEALTTVSYPGCVFAFSEHFRAPIANCPWCFGKIGQTESVVLEVRTDAWDESTEQVHKEFLDRDARDSHPFACLFNMFFIEYPHEADSVLAPRGEMGLHRLYF